ncbi:MAG TPA: mechanosensitive ion channel [Candidatus Coprenecus stercoravium]|uniref:Mechanosensitive ion channel n=1 Tax=Candidatus Coprenecus stercoravium TaxID=2840735 RepID=A0A9D2KAE8_9BACT|nr:mechanosensitive ion channel [Candidatus Coprenecus stercoravium]
MLPQLDLTPDPSDTLAVEISETITKLSSMSGHEILTSVSETVIKWGLKVLAAILLYLLGAWIIRRIRKMLRNIFQKRKIEPSLATFTVSFVNISLTVLLFVVVVSILGVPTSTFAALLAAGGLAVGMALSGTLQNFAGGVMLLLFKPFKVGDYIEANGFGGTVDAINITSTQIHTVDNKIVHLPNGSVANSNILNYSTSDIRRVDWNISVSYGDDAEKGIALLKEYLSKDPRVLSTPEEPFAALSQLGDSAIVLTARAWTKNSDYWSLYFDINKLIYDDFPKKGMTFPYPQLDVHVRNVQD